MRILAVFLIAAFARTAGEERILARDRDYAQAIDLTAATTKNHQVGQTIVFRRLSPFRPPQSEP